MTKMYNQFPMGPCAYKNKHYAVLLY